jgi:hypothetical protein
MKPSLEMFDTNALGELYKRGCDVLLEIREIKKAPGDNRVYMTNSEAMQFSADDFDRELVDRRKRLNLRESVLGGLPSKEIYAEIFERKAGLSRPRLTKRSHLNIVSDSALAVELVNRITDGEIKIEFQSNSPKTSEPVEQDEPLQPYITIQVYHGKKA